MKKAITVLGLGAAAVAISVSNASALEQQVQATAGVNLREQPSATSNKVSELQEGASLTVISSQDGWTNVQTEDGQSGWVSGYYVSGDQTGATSQSNNIENQSKNVVESSDESVQVKSTYNDENVQETNKVNNTAINTTSKINSSNVKTSQNVSGDVSSNAKIASTSYLNVRLGPSTSNGISGKIYKGEIFKVVSKSSNGWYKVVLKDGTTGWASGKYINLTNEEDKSNVSDYIKTEETKKSVKTSENKASLNSNQGVVTSKVGLNVRSGAGSKNSVISTLASNSIVNIIGQENGWYKIKLDNGQVGYVGASLISKSASALKTASSVKDASTKNVVNNEVVTNAHTSASTTSVATGNTIVDYAQTLLGTTYSWGGTTTAGFDCSGFTQYVYRNAAGISIPRVSRAQAGAGASVSTSDMQAGDLLYFDTTGSGTTSHVGIYMGNGKFIHASGTAAKPEHVKISNLTEGWVKLLGARRL